MFLVGLWLLCGLLFKQSESTTRGATLSIELIYSNPQSKLDDGSTCDRIGDNRCDVYFKLCLQHATTDPQRSSSGKCALYQYTTQTYENTATVKFTDRERFQVHIAQPVPNSYTFELEIWDADFIPSRESIGTFVAENLDLLPTGSFTDVPLKNRNANSRNHNLEIQLRMRLECGENLFGNHCMIECVPAPKRYTCNSEGKKICKEGFTGENCEHEDSCFYEPCATHATCSNRIDGTGRVCICNGHEGPECYPGFDPCSSSPCEHNGHCSAMGLYGESFHCNCSELWSGHRCTERRLACEEAAANLTVGDPETKNSVNSTDVSEVCLNGGKCLEYSDKFAFRCVCINGWTGERCDIREQNETSINLLMLLLVSLVGMFIIILATALTVGFIWHFRKNNRTEKLARGYGGIVYFHNDRDSTATVASILPLPNSDTYGNAHLPDQIYVRSPNQMLTPRRQCNDVYDECDPFGVYNKTGVYGTTFGRDSPKGHRRGRNSELPGQDESAPPLPERPKNLGSLNSRQNSVTSIPTVDTTLSYTRVGSPRSSVGSPNERRQPTIYRPLSPTFYQTQNTLERFKEQRHTQPLIES
ncbi:hypothetical protein PHET_00431 [Paragonimus heterotremus]|uniref:EGF-like domain-containing protein n=1 Tax=Paragonimus heterotremus TaxID=100268 RepID=A0A8J4SUR9_9TREM|nr:hypothetical protein PHET_00431 [Paragonimus heterotremus]